MHRLPFPPRHLALLARADRDRRAWKEITVHAAQQVTEADAKIADCCRQMSVPESFRLGLHMSWYRRCENACRARRADLRWMRGGETVNAEQIAAELDKARRTQNGWTCLYPTHDDHNPSFSIADGIDRNLLFTCFAGCEAGDIIVTLKSRGQWPESGRGGNFRKRPVPTTPKRETRATAAYASQIWVRGEGEDDVVATHPYAVRRGVRHASGVCRSAFSLAHVFGTVGSAP